MKRSIAHYPAFAWLLTLSVVCAWVSIAPTAYAQAADTAAGTGKTSTATPWLTRKVQGWTVKISRKLLADDKAAVERAMKLLEAQLKRIVRSVPAPAVSELKKVTLWFSPEYERIVPRAEYHPNVKWLESNGRDPVMAKGVEFTNVRIFEAETRRMPNFALHELAHAYHDRVLGFDHQDIIASYEQAKASGKYDRVQKRDARGELKYARAYALTNHKEYFAEVTEAYFDRNDIFPFERGELVRTDPEAVAVLKKVWGTDNAGG